MLTYKHILVAVDVCEDFDPIIKKAIDFADGNPATRISLIHVVEPVYYPENYMGGLLVDVQQKSVDFAVEELVPAIKKFDLDKKNVHVVIGRHASMVHEFAENNDVDLIVIGSHGKQGLQLLLGSTATAVLHGAKCDVIAIRIEE